MGFECDAEQRVIAPVTLADAGGITGTLVEAVTRRPVEGAMLDASKIEWSSADRSLISNGRTLSDAFGHYHIGGLAPGVYNLTLGNLPRGERFTAQAVEGVRVKPGDDAQADLTLVAARRLQGTVVDIKTGMPLSRVTVTCSCSALPLSGNIGQPGHTDDQGRFEFLYLLAWHACSLREAVPSMPRVLTPEPCSFQPTATRSLCCSMEAVI